jgi:hypothetical protein
MLVGQSPSLPPHPHTRSHLPASPRWVGGHVCGATVAPEGGAFRQVATTCQEGAHWGGGRGWVHFTQAGRTLAGPLHQMKLTEMKAPPPPTLAAPTQAQAHRQATAGEARLARLPPFSSQSHTRHDKQANGLHLTHTLHTRQPCSPQTPSHNTQHTSSTQARGQPWVLSPPGRKSCPHASAPRP